MTPSVIETTETMTSTQLAAMLDYEKKEINKKIRTIFGEDKAREKFSPALDAQGRVVEYFLPELESKMFVAKHDIEYLEMITQYWIDRNKPKSLSPAEVLMQQAQFMLETERKLAEQEAALKSKADKQEVKVVQAKVENFEHRLDNRGCDTGYMMVSDAHRSFGDCVSYDTFKLVCDKYEVESKPLVSEYGSLTKQVLIESVIEKMEQFKEETVLHKGTRYMNPKLGVRKFTYQA